MKPLTTLLFGLSLFISSGSNTNYEEAFGNDYTSAKQFLAEHHNEFILFCDGNEKAEILEAVVFPELLRYSMFRDLLETSFLELLYVEHGIDGADFSIGRFQMKPSFAETIEQHFKDFSEATVFRYASSSEEKIRKERLGRLQSVDWQIQYLKAFYQILEKRWGENFPPTKEEQVLLLATAYNRGMLNSLETLRKHANDKVFPYGNNFIGKQYSYAEISLDYYQKTQSQNR